MAEVSVHLDGLNLFLNDMDREDRRIQDGMRYAVDATGREVIATSQANAPRGETSFLTQSHVWEFLGGTLSGTGFQASGHAKVLAPYAAAQNFGIPGRPSGGAVTNPSAVSLGPVFVPGSLLGATPNVQQVRAHTRTITQAFGRFLKAPVTVNVRAHLRRARIPATFFFSNALADAPPKLEQRLEAVVNG